VNAHIRRYFEKRSKGDEDSPENARLPPLPGRAIFHLTELLGLSGDGAVIAVKCSVVLHGVASNLFWAVAAMCPELAPMRLQLQYWKQYEWKEDIVHCLVEGTAQ